MRGGIMYDKGDVVLIPFPYSDLSGNKKRPALIISNEKINKTDDRICCLITSKSRRDDLLITKKDFLESNLPFKSWIRPHRVFTIDKRIILKRLCKLNGKFTRRLLEKIIELI